MPQPGHGCDDDTQGKADEEGSKKMLFVEENPSKDKSCSPGQKPYGRKNTIYETDSLQGDQGLILKPLRNPGILL